MQPITRSQRILALVPRPGADSDLEKSGSSEDELKLPARISDSDSSPAPSIAASLENLHLLSDSDSGTDEIVVPTKDGNQSVVLPTSTLPCSDVTTSSPPAPTYSPLTDRYS